MKPPKAPDGKTQLTQNSKENANKKPKFDQELAQMIASILMLIKVQNQLKISNFVITQPIKFFF